MSAARETGAGHGAHPLAHEQVRVIARVLVAYDAEFGGLHFKRMPREVRELLARLREEEGRILARGDSRIDFRSRSCAKSAGKRTRERGCQ